MFEEEPTEVIDRRTLPTIMLTGDIVEKAEAFANRIDASGSMALDVDEPILGLVAEGVIELDIVGQKAERIPAGGTFALPTVGADATIRNMSVEVPAKVITFKLH